MSKTPPKGVKTFTIQEALKAGYTTAYKSSTCLPLTMLNPDDCSGYILYEEVKQKTTFTKEDLLPNLSAYGVDLKEDYLRGLPEALWDKILKPLNNWSKENPLVYKEAVGLLINRRV